MVPLNAEPTPTQKADVRAKAGLDWDSLRDAWKYCESFGGPHSVLVMRHGWVAAEWRNYEGARGIASCTKQACWIFPGLDMVVVRIGSNVTLNQHPEFYRELLSRVMKAVSKE